MNDWKQIVPMNTASLGRTSTQATGKMSDRGLLSLSRQAVQFLGTVERVHVYWRENPYRFLIVAASNADEDSWILGGGGPTTHRVRLARWHGDHPDSEGFYKVRPIEYLGFPAIELTQQTYRREQRD